MISFNKPLIIPNSKLLISSKKQNIIFDHVEICSTSKLWTSICENHHQLFLYILKLQPFLNNNYFYWFFNQVTKYKNNDRKQSASLQFPLAYSSLLIPSKTINFVGVTFIRMNSCSFTFLFSLIFARNF